MKDKRDTAKTANQDIMRWIREGGLFVIVCNLITVFKYILLQFLPAAFAKRRGPVRKIHGNRRVPDHLLPSSDAADLGAVRRADSGAGAERASDSGLGTGAGLGR